MAAVNTISKLNIASGGSSDWGTLPASRYGQVGCSNATNDRALFSGGGSTGSGSEGVQYMTITSSGASTGGTYLSANCHYGSSTSNGTGEKAIVCLHSTSYARIDTMTINSLSESTDFGDITPTTRASGTATSDGLGQRGLIAGGENSGYKNDFTSCC